MNKHFKYCAKYVRQYDKSRYLSGSLANKEHRLQLFSLYAFDIEISLIRSKINDAFPGEVRIQWWRDVITEMQHEKVENHPIANALITTINEYQLPIDPICNLLEARTFDVYNDPMPTLHDLDGYLGETSSVLFQLAANILTNNTTLNLSDACGHAGVAYALTNILRSIPLHSRRRQLYLPMELIKKHNVNESDIFNFTTSNGLTEMLIELRQHIRHHLMQFNKFLPQIPLTAFPTFLPLCLVEPYLARMESSQYDPFKTKIELSLYQRMKLIWSTAKTVKRMSVK